MRLGDDEILRRFRKARDAGDEAEADRWWSALVERHFDRVRGFVEVWSRGGRLSPDERDEAVQRALVRLWKNLAVSFEGTSMGEWVNALRTLVDFACRDVQRDAARRSRRERSFEEHRSDPGGERSGAHDARLAQLAVEEQRRSDERADASRFADWALPRLSNARRRVVLERSLDGVPAEAIARELDVTMANLYQLRSRGLRELADLHRDYQA